MEITELLTDAFRRVHDGVRDVLDGLDADALAHRPDPGANSICWLVWHATRVQDDHLAELVGRGQAWTGEGWAQRLGLPLDDADTGYGHSSTQVASVAVDDPDLLLGYHEAVAAHLTDDLDAAVAGGLDRIVDRRWEPPVDAGVRLVSVLNDVTQHVGQAAYVRGAYERQRR